MEAQPDPDILISPEIAPMCLAPTAIVADARPDQPKPRARRVLSDRSRQRRARVLAILVDPIVVVETPETLTDRARDISEAFKPRNGWQDWLTSAIATILVRLDRCERIERRLREYASYRAIDFWEDDQTLEVETLATKINKDPGRVVAKLRQSPTGCGWLLKRWRPLARLEPAAWTDDQRTLAGLILGGDRDTDPTAAGFAAGRVADLEAQRERVEQADAILRGLVEADLSDEGVAGLAKLRRYARSLHRQLKWSIDQFHVEHPDRWDDPMRQPGTISRDLLRDQNSRKPHWSFTEPEPAPKFAETNPLLDDVELRKDETKPFSPEPQPGNDETKPSVRVGLIGSLADAVPQPIVAEEVAVHHSGSEPGYRGRRKGRLQPTQEVSRRQKAARRRAALACVGGV